VDLLPAFVLTSICAGGWPAVCDALSKHYGGTPIGRDERKESRIQVAIHRESGRGATAPGSVAS